MLLRTTRLMLVVLPGLLLEPALGQVEMIEAGADLTLETVATDLEVPWSIDFAPDGRIFVTERLGRIRSISPDGFRIRLWALPEVVHLRSTGLMGLAVDPDFASTRQIYVLGTFADEDGRLKNRVYRLTDRDGYGQDLQVVLDELPWGRFHGGGELAFGPDKKIYLTIGDTGQVAEPQNRRSLIGKVLRYNRDGTVPEDNPYPGSPVYALGIRNTLALDWHPETGHLFAVENGPSNFPWEGGRRHQDELNVILPGENYGWPVVSGMHQDSRFVTPLAEWTPAISPAGLAFCNWKGSLWYGNLFVAAMRGYQLRRLVVEKDLSRPSGWRVVQQQILFHQKLGRIRAVAMGPDGYLYFANTNHDSDGYEKGLIQGGDDRLFRVKLP